VKGVAEVKSASEEGDRKKGREREKSGEKIRREKEANGKEREVK